MGILTFAKNKKIQLPLAFLGGVLCMAVWSSINTDNTLNANLTEEQLDARANGVISTQKEEINRLRRMLQEGTPVTSQVNVPTGIDGTKNCTTHNECGDIDMICKNNTCTRLADPICACQSNANGSYILCISNQGAGNEARTVSCGANACSDSPRPNCVLN